MLLLSSMTNLLQNKIIKVSALILILVLFTFTFASPVAAQSLMQFGGWVSFVFYCACSNSWLVSYMPPYPLTYPWVTRQLVLTPTTILHAYTQFLTIPVITSWHLGQFVPGVQMCWIPGTPCIVVPSDGAIFRVGSSFPGWPSPLGT
jgi:hypothetical protein